MTIRAVTLLSAGASLGAALVGGVFFAFSTFVMRALGELTPERGIAAMQAINVAAINRWLMGALFGTAVVTMLVGIMSTFTESGLVRVLRVSGAAIYLVGALVVTGVCNVPRNESLATLPPHAADAATTWWHYLAEWTAWNHVRMGACLLSALLFAITLIAFDR